MQKEHLSIMIVSNDPKMIDYLKKAMPRDRFFPVFVFSNAADARRNVLQRQTDIVIIDTPLPDEFGTKLAQDLSLKCAAAVIVKPELSERISYKLEQYGIVTLPRTLHKALLYQTFILLSISVTKTKTLSKDRDNLKAKLREVKNTSKAKALLISKKSMTEEEAHQYIQKAAMDSCKKKSEIIEDIIEKLSD